MRAAWRDGFEQLPHHSGADGYEPQPNRQAASRHGMYICALSLSLYIYIYFVIKIIYGRLHCDSDLLICHHPQGCSSSVRRSRASGHLLLRHEACSPDCASHRNSVWFSCMYQTFILQLQHLEYITIYHQSIGRAN